MAGGDQPKVSVLVVSYNTRDLLRRCLESLKAADPIPAEVIVVDNDSSDGSAAMVAEEFPEVTLLRPGENLGFGRANNLAAAKAAGEYLFLLNSDAAVEPVTVLALVDFLESTPQAGIVAPRLYNPDGSFQPSARSFPCPTNLFLEATGLDRLTRRTEHWGFTGGDTRPVEYVSGAALMIRRGLWESLGGFDDGYFFYGEDADLCRRALDEGQETWYFHTAVALHDGGASTARLRLNAALEGYRSYLRFIRDHQGRKAVWWARIWIGAGATLRACLCLLPAAFAHSWRRRLRIYLAVGRLALSASPYPIGRFGWPEGGDS